MPETPKRTPRKKKAERSAAEVFGSNLRRHRLSQSRTQADIAHLAGLSQTKLPMIELGKTDVRLSTARKLARAIGVPLRDLLPD